MAIDLTKLNRIETNLVTPTVNESLIETERDRWGNILNDITLKTLNTNINILKEVVLDLGNNSNVSNLSDITTSIEKLELDVANLERLIDDNTSNELNIGNSERVLNLITKDNFKVNGQEFTRNSQVQAVSDSPFKEFEAKSILRSTLPLTDSTTAGNNESRQITFDRTFSSIPFVFVNLNRTEKTFSIVSTYEVTTTGFKISLNYAGGDCQVQYIAFTLKD